MGQCSTNLSLLLVPHACHLPYNHSRGCHSMSFPSMSAELNRKEDGDKTKTSWLCLPLTLALPTVGLRVFFPSSPNEQPSIALEDFHSCTSASTSSPPPYSPMHPPDLLWRIGEKNGPNQPWVCGCILAPGMGNLLSSRCCSNSHHFLALMAGDYES